MKENWILKDQLKEDQKLLLQLLSKDIPYPEPFLKILIKRGFRTTKEINEFLNPHIQNICDPLLLNGVSEGVQRIVDAIEKKEKITIYGDYDVDGITSVSMLLTGLKMLNSNVDYFIPDRMQEGYGLSPNGVKALIEKKSRVIITVDCGINSVDEVEELNKNGIDVIVTDHHLPKEILPAAIALINPKLSSSTYPNESLCGVGVAYKLLMALFSKMDKIDLLEENDFLDFVSMGTIADIVPLTKENRAILYFGFKQMSKKNNIGISTFLQKLKIDPNRIKSTDIVFKIAPRINSTGRMANANIAVDFLTTTKKEKASKLFERIEGLNRQRRGIELSVYNDACLQIEHKYSDLDKTNCIVLSNENWHPGVVGIVASKLVEKYYKPTFLFSESGGISRASCRSIPNINIIDVINSAKEYIITFGGHKYAAGVSLLNEYLPKFEEKINKYITKNYSKDIFISKLTIESEIELEDINYELLKFLKKMAPFGSGNHKPIFLTQRVQIINYPQIVGQNSLKIKVRKDEGSLELIGFNMMRFYSHINRNSLIDIVYSLDINVWRDRKNIQGYLKDIYVHPH